MEKDRIADADKWAEGAGQEAVGKDVGDTKLVAAGESDKVESKVQNAIGSLKAALNQ